MTITRPMSGAFASSACRRSTGSCSLPAPSQEVESGRYPHGAPRSANEMSTGSGVTERELDRIRHLVPGRDAGRMVDGVDVLVDGWRHLRMPPRWERSLAAMGWHPERGGSISFELTTPAAAHVSFGDVRAALTAARAAVESGHDPWSVDVRAVTPSGQAVSVVRGTPIVGMAIGATEDPPITLIESPSILPRHPPGEEPLRTRFRHRRHGRPARRRDHGAARRAQAARSR